MGNHRAPEKRGLFRRKVVPVTISQRPEAHFMLYFLDRQTGEVHEARFVLPEGDETRYQSLWRLHIEKDWKVDFDQDRFLFLSFGRMDSVHVGIKLSR